MRAQWSVEAGVATPHELRQLRSGLERSEKWLSRGQKLSDGAREHYTVIQLPLILGNL